MAVRIAHLSDIHIAQLPEDSDGVFDYFITYFSRAVNNPLAQRAFDKLIENQVVKKKIIKYLNLIWTVGIKDKKILLAVAALVSVLGVLGYRYRRQIINLSLSLLRKDAETIRNELIKNLKDKNVNHLAISGDFTNVHNDAEFEKAQKFLNEIRERIPHLGITIVPGNHDLEETDKKNPAIILDKFNQHLSDFLPREHRYPVLNTVNDNVLILGINSNSPAIGFGTDGKIDKEQLRRTMRYLLDWDKKPKVLILHHHLRKKGIELGMPPMEGADVLLNVAKATGVNLILHGHKHDFYKMKDTNEKYPPTYCAGSSTKATNLIRKELVYRIFEFDNNKLINKKPETVRVAVPKNKKS